MKKISAYYRIIQNLTCMGFFFTLIFAVKSFENAVPDEIYVRAGETVSYDFDVPVSVVLKQDSTEVFEYLTKDSPLTYCVNCRLFGIFPVKDITVMLVEPETVYASGMPVGIYAKTKGVLVIGNGEVERVDGRKEEEKLMSVGNNHGGLVEVNGQWYIFYHRHTYLNQYNRQGCAERIFFDKNGKIPQVTITTSGMNPEPLSGNASYPAVYCCNLTNGHMGALSSLGRTNKEIDFPYMTCEAGERFITNIKDRNRIGYKYINLKETKKIEVIYQTDTDGELEIYTELGKESKGIIKLAPSTWWKAAETNVSFEHDRVLYLVYRGQGSLSLITLNLKN